MDYEQVVSPNLKSLRKSFGLDIENLKTQSVGHKTRITLLNSIDNDIEFIIKGLAEESSLRTQTEYINNWISKSILCQKTVFSLGDYLKRLSTIFQTAWRRYIESGNDRRTFIEINQIYGLFHGTCQNIGIAIDDYIQLHAKIDSNISKREADFIPTYVQHPELKVSERISQLYSEARNWLLLVNRTESMLGFSAVRIVLESFVIIKVGDKIRQYIRKEKSTNKIEIRFTSRFKTKDVFYITRNLFPMEKENKALSQIYNVSSNTIHRALSQPNYISWQSLWFSIEQLERMIDNLSIDDPKLKALTKKLVDEEKLTFI